VKERGSVFIDFAVLSQNPIPRETIIEGVEG